MVEGPSGLARLVRPTPLERFFAEHWESAPLHVSHPADEFQDLFRLEDVDHLLSLPGLIGSEHFRLLARDAPGDVLPARVEGGTLSLAQVYRGFDAGATINVLGVHRFWPRIGALCRALEETLHHRLYCNLFFTPADAPPLHAHYDDQDVLILQLSGSKSWRIDETPFPLPLRGDFADVPLGDDPRDIVLQAGDVLYLPRGFVHEPAALDGPSLHLTVGITPHRWADLLASALVSRAQRTRSLRRALPPGVLFDHTRHPELERTFRELAAECLADLSLAEAVDHLGASSMAEMHPLPVGHFAQLSRRQDTTSVTRVERRPGMVCRVRSLNGCAVIQFPGNQVSGPASVGAAFEHIAAARSDFAVGDLPGLGASSQITLVRQLVLEGLLRYV